MSDTNASGPYKPAHGINFGQIDTGKLLSHAALQASQKAAADTLNDDPFPGISPEVVDAINQWQFVDRAVFAQTLAETVVQYTQGLGLAVPHVVHFGLRDGRPAVLIDLTGADLLPVRLCSDNN